MKNKVGKITKDQLMEIVKQKNSRYEY